VPFLLAAGWAIFVLLAIAVLEQHADRIGNGYAHAGYWVGWSLIGVSAAPRIGDVVLARSSSSGSMQH
jgi:hypothetical protein